MVALTRVQGNTSMQLAVVRTGGSEGPRHCLGRGCSDDAVMERPQP